MLSKREQYKSNNKPFLQWIWQFAQEDIALSSSMSRESTRVMENVKVAATFKHQKSSLKFLYLVLTPPSPNNNSIATAYIAAAIQHFFLEV